MRFLHTSDWHIGRLFQNISLLEDQQYVLSQIKDYALAHNVDAIIVAGDIFDRSVPPAHAVDVLDRFLVDLQQHDIPVIMISGNHDSAKRLRFGARQMRLANLHILADLDHATEPVIVKAKGASKDSEHCIAFYGLPYHDPVEVREAFANDIDDDGIGEKSIRTYDDAHTFMAEKILSEHKKHRPQMTSVLISHCFIDGASESDSERPLAIGGADRVSWQPLTSFDYVALGHLHGPQFKGAEQIRYSGSPLKYSFSEYKQNKSVTLVEFAANDASTANPSITLLPLKARHNLRVIEGELSELIENGKQDPNFDDYLLVRLTDKQSLLEPLARLRKVYPNVLQLERKQFTQDYQAGNKADGNGENTGQKKDELQIFSEFFSQVTESELSASQQQVLQDAINQAKALTEGKE
ncbi:exonuclease SbcCD subunit D [Thalassotalea litorea]|uniref:Nuclease SbcCD subunit D n=1 Tax=Thalassotalea litorea TaxID=2020715 RepID=A0A5R9IPQ0_9GAMM|nr:exonuclease SbcCD subunit D [Thalassotalea litorea]TLU67500.1 exonuclease SbcCD subunit D [Thalassotalea litorea]